MKNRRVIAILLAMTLAAGTMLSGCQKSSDGNSGQATQQEEEQNQDVLSFVAADKTNWDKEVALGGYAFTLAIHLNEDGTLLLEGVCVGEAPEEQMPGGGNIGEDDGQDMPQEETLQEKTEQGNAENGNAENGGEDNEDFSKYDFEIEGTWSYETGWGYTLSFDDGQDTTITANFDKASSRQYFYYEMEPTIGGQKAERTQVQFQAEDREFRSEMAADYVTAEERNAKYIFEGKGNSATGNAIKTQVYCEEDGSLAILTQSGSSTTYSTGTWKEDETVHQLTITADGEDTIAYYSETAEKQGYCLIVTSSGGPGPSSFLLAYCSLTDGVGAGDFTEDDFPAAAAELESLSSAQSGFPF